MHMPSLITLLLHRVPGTICSVKSTAQMVAVEKAIEIISSGAVAGNADKHLPSMLQKATALNQLRSSSNTQVQSRVAQYLQAQAAKMNSRVLSAVAVRAAEDPFNKVYWADWQHDLNLFSPPSSHALSRPANK